MGLCKKKCTTKPLHTDQIQSNGSPNPRMSTLKELSLRFNWFYSFTSHLHRRRSGAEINLLGFQWSTDEGQGNNFEADSARVEISSDILNISKREHKLFWFDSYYFRGSWKLQFRWIKFTVTGRYLRTGAIDTEGLLNPEWLCNHLDVIRPHQGIRQMSSITYSNLLTEKFCLKKTCRKVHQDIGKIG